MAEAEVIDLEALPPVLTVPQAARVLQIPVKTCYDLVRHGKIPGKKLGVKIVRISKKALLEFLEGQ